MHMILTLLFHAYFTICSNSPFISLIFLAAYLMLLANIKLLILLLNPP
jgi:hypothetical protein